MANDYSDSDDEDRHRSKRKSKPKRYSRSRSVSRDRDKVQKSKKSSKHRRRSRSKSVTSEKKSKRRSRSRSAEKTRRRSRSRSAGKSRRRSRSHSADKNRRRSRSRSSEYSSKHRGHRKSRSVSRSRRSESHSRSDHDSRKSSRSRDSHRSFSSKPGEQSKDTKNNAQLAEKKLQKALKAAITADDILRAQGVQISSLQTKTGQLSFEEQKNRASAVNDIESGEFVQGAFKSSRSEIPLPLGSSVDASHAGAMFSSGPSARLPATLSASSHGGCTLPGNTNSIMHPDLYIGVDEKMEKWKQKVIELRRQKLAIA